MTVHEHMKALTPRQLTMLRDYANDGEATDYAEFDDAGTLAWCNRERVIEALWRRGLLGEDGVTEAGREVIAALGSK